VFSFAGPRLATMAYHVISFFSRTKVAGKHRDTSAGQKLQANLKKCYAFIQKYSGLNTTTLKLTTMAYHVIPFFSMTKLPGKHRDMFDINHNPKVCFYVEIVCARGGNKNTMKTNGGINAPILTLYYFKMIKSWKLPPRA
jgi:hypothetical protein